MKRPMTEARDHQFIAHSGAAERSQSDSATHLVSAGIVSFCLVIFRQP